MLIGEKDEKKILADSKTNLANERTLLANERTFIAWIRTGLALVSAGLGVIAFLGEFGPTILIRGMGILLVITGEASYVFAYWRYRKILNRLKDVGIDVTPFWLLLVLTIVIFALTIVSLIVILRV
ncbi:YidH family protein [Gudongella sp. DL1XJH-153]|uniref:YidH family protein n=1 Tax=Gudongella sp. DL1XJH-153 TaxID=3409804 RepID=UPI003BB4B006